MTPAATFPDIEKVVCAALLAKFDGLKADTVTPADWKDHLPFARVVCHGGRDDTITDTSRLTIDWFDETREAAQAGVEALRQFITSRGGFNAEGATVDAGDTDSKPQDIPWNDANTPRRFVYSCTVAARRSTS